MEEGRWKMEEKAEGRGKREEKADGRRAPH
jgi:hypothetical protein